MPTKIAWTDASERVHNTLCTPRGCKGSGWCWCWCHDCRPQDDREHREMPRC